MYQWQLIDPSLSIGFHFDIYHSHKSSINQLLNINQSICINDTWSNNLPNNQTIGINDNMIQQYPPLALKEIPTLMSTPITNYWCQHVDKACSTLIVNVTFSPHQYFPINRHQSHQCDYLSPFDINGKGPFSSWYGFYDVVQFGWFGWWSE